MSQPLANPANLSSYKTLLSKGKTTKKEDFRDPKFRPHEVKRFRKRSKSRSPSPKSGYKKSKPIKKEKINYDIPDRHFGDFFCKACECHMNSEDMWYHHIAGKRHAKNTKGLTSGVVGKKFDDVEGEPPEAQKLIDAEEAPLVGLSDIRESQKPDRTTYYCFLCSASIETGPLMIEHVISIKHRMSYLKEYDKERYKIINESMLNKEQMDAIVLECVTKIQEEKGRGKMKIQRKIPDAYGKDYEPKAERSKYSWKQHASTADIPLSGSNLTPRPLKRNEDLRYNDPYPEYDDRYYRRSPERMPPREDFLPREDMYESRRDYYEDNYRMPPRNLPKPSTGISSDDADLRLILEQKRSTVSNVTDEALSIISALPTVSFFQLVLFKLDSIDIENEMELKYLDRVVNKATSMSVKVNSQKFTPNLVEKFQESVKKTNLEVSNAQNCSTSMQDLLRLVEDYKDMRNLDKPVETRVGNIPYSKPQSAFTNELPEPPRFPQVLSGLFSSDDVSKIQTGYSSTRQPIISNTSAVDSNSLRYSSEHNSSNTYDSTFSSFSSNPVSIPGLTLAQNQDQGDSHSPFQELEAKAKSIFGKDQWSSGNAQTPMFSYRNEPGY